MYKAIPRILESGSDVYMKQRPPVVRVRERTVSAGSITMAYMEVCIPSGWIVDQPPAVLPRGGYAALLRTGHARDEDNPFRLTHIPAKPDWFPSLPDDPDPRRRRTFNALLQEHASEWAFFKAAMEKTSWRSLFLDSEGKREAAVFFRMKQVCASDDSYVLELPDAHVFVYCKENAGPDLLDGNRHRIVFMLGYVFDSTGTLRGKLHVRTEGDMTVDRFRDNAWKLFAGIRFRPVGETSADTGATDAP